MKIIQCQKLEGMLGVSKFEGGVRECYENIYLSPGPILLEDPLAWTLSKSLYFFRPAFPVFIKLELRLKLYDK